MNLQITSPATAESVGAVDKLADLRAGIVAYWPLSNTNDASGNGFNLDNPDGVTFVPGKIGNCASFTGNFLSCFADLNPAGWTEYTFAGWFKASNPGDGTQVLLGGAWKTSAYQFIVNLYEGSPNTIRAWTGVDILSMEFVIATSPDNLTVFNNQWHHFASVFSSGTQRLYLDGNLVAEAVFPSNRAVTQTDGIDAAFALGLAGGAGEGNRAFEGLLDEVGIWRCALSASQVSSLYNNGLGISLFQ